MCIEDKNFYNILSLVSKFIKIHYWFLTTSNADGPISSAKSYFTIWMKMHEYFSLTPEILRKRNSYFMQLSKVFFIRLFMVPPFHWTFIYISISKIDRQSVNLLNCPKPTSKLVIFQRKAAAYEKEHAEKMRKKIPIFNIVHGLYQARVILGIS